jgi:hypothetical protein
MLYHFQEKYNKYDDAAIERYNKSASDTWKRVASVDANLIRSGLLETVFKDIYWPLEGEQVWGARR